MQVRTRFAPSPTGNVHIGNIRAAIFNWLFSRHEGGVFLLRVEDTDRERSTQESIQNLLDAMAWLGLDYDEDLLYQSTRMDAHLEVAEQLLSRGLAYKEDKGNTGKGKAILFRMPGDDITFHDEIKGDLLKKAGDLKDLVIVRSNGTPVFHLANVVDDIHMNISHVIRGDDHIENTYRHAALYRALGADLPRFVHLPMIVNAAGRPYSKRDGDAYVGEFQSMGIMPDALFNYLALLGWSPGDDREVMTRDEMVRDFDLGRVQSSAAQMDPQKLLWMNGEYLSGMPEVEFNQACRKVLGEAGLLDDSVSDQRVNGVCGLMKGRLRLFEDIVEQTRYFFETDYAYDDKAVRKRLTKEGAMELLTAMLERFQALSTFNAQTTEEALRALAGEREVSAGQLIHPVRVAVSGQASGPSLFDMLEVMGQETVVRRVKKTLERFGHEQASADNP